MPAMTFIGNLVYVGIAVVGGLQVAFGAMQLGDVQALMNCSLQFTQPLAQLVFEDISFSYSPDKPLISGLSLVAEPGQTVAIVGPCQRWSKTEQFRGLKTEPL